LIAADIDVCQVDDQHHIVIADRRAEEERAAPSKEKLEPREKPCPMMEEPLSGTLAADYVAVLIEYAEGVPVFEHAERTWRPLRLGDNRELVVKLQHVRH
jgi:hypothetical protein